MPPPPRRLTLGLAAAGALGAALATRPVPAAAEPPAAAPVASSAAPPAAASATPAASAPRAGRITVPSEDGKPRACREQKAQDFLVRGNWFPKTNDAEAVKKGQKLLQDAIRYRTEQYGFFEGFGQKGWNKHPPKHYAKTTTFLGLSVQVHEKVVPALACVEAALKAEGLDAAYHPRSMGGMRFKNTYRGVEVSNHVYGIAVDLEPDKNTCCGCVKPWTEHPLCKNKNLSVWERMAMPRSWVEVFERYGFYWLGHDVLQDTMHFEFLGDPAAITEPA